MASTPSCMGMLGYSASTSKHSMTQSGGSVSLVSALTTTVEDDVYVFISLITGCSMLSRYLEQLCVMVLMLEAIGLLASGVLCIFITT